MKTEVDQFGRSSINTNDLSNDKSKRIFDALRDIKDQLQNDEFIPKVEKGNISENKETKKYYDHDLDFKNLQYKIERLEKKINQIDENLHSGQKSNFVKEEEINKEELSIFHKIENNKLNQKQSKSIMVLENQNPKNISNFKFYHFLILLIILITVLTLITSKKLGLSILESLNFFLISLR
tara:strand:- start:258 stop:800 length:543 start_codon:yes stop_codon:yes gene_type:complete